MAEQARFCASCGKALTGARPFCNYCGAHNTVTASGTESVANPARKKSSPARITAIVVGGLVLVATLGVLGVTYTRRTPSALPVISSCSPLAGVKRPDTNDTAAAPAQPPAAA